MSVEALTVPAFQGLDLRGRGGIRSERKSLDTPRELVNLHVDDNGHLYFPKAVNESVWDFGSEVWIRTMHYLDRPRGLIVQLNTGDIYRIPISRGSPEFIEPITVQPLASMPSGETHWNLWVNSCGSYGVMGYMPRSTAGPATDGKTWQIEGGAEDPDPPTVTDLGDSVPKASYSMLHKGRRFTVGRGRTVQFSEMNQYLTFDEDSTFRVSGDDAGTGIRDNPGFVHGMTSFEDALTIFLSNSVWLLTGSSPDNFRLRQVQTTIGNARSWTLDRTEAGIFTFSGRWTPDRGIYLFTGNTAQKVSTPVDELFRNNTPNTATFSAGRYVVCMNESDVDDTQLIIFDIEARRWNTMDGFRRGEVEPMGDGYVVSDQGKLYRLREQDSLIPRAPGRPGKVTLGFHDDENPTGLQRFLGIKLSGWAEGSVSVTLTVTLPDGSYATGQHTLPEGVFDGYVLPVNLRGPSAEVSLELNGADDAHALIENLQLIHSRKGEKVSRG